MPAAAPSPLLAATMRKRKAVPASRSRLMRWADLPTLATSDWKFTVSN